MYVIHLTDLSVSFVPNAFSTAASQSNLGFKSFCKLDHLRPEKHDTIFNYFRVSKRLAISHPKLAVHEFKHLSVVVNYNLVGAAVVIIVFIIDIIINYYYYYYYYYYYCSCCCGCGCCCCQGRSWCQAGKANVPAPPRKFWTASLKLKSNFFSKM